jgi:hypothetical protein
VILGFLAVEAERQVVAVLGQRIAVPATSGMPL